MAFVSLAGFTGGDLPPMSPELIVHLIIPDSLAMFSSQDRRMASLGGLGGANKVIPGLHNQELSQKAEMELYRTLIL